MRKSISILGFLSIVVLQLNAQRELSNPLIDSKEILTQGIALHDAGKYKEAIATYNKVSTGDTAYSTVLNELILSYYSDSNFVEAERYIRIAMKLYPHNNIVWYTLLADVYDDTKRVDLALKVYDSVLVQNPHSYLTFFNKGITLYRQSRFDEATTNFQRCIVINPYYASAHYFLGQLAMSKGNMVPAILSFSTCLIIAPDGRYQKNTTNFLNSIAEMNTDATGYLQNYKPGKEDDFDEVHEIFVSKVALDKKYKLKADLEDQIVRQLQVVIEKLEYNANDKGFWMQYYVPLFKKIWDNNQFEPMVFNMFSGLDIKSVKTYIKKEKGKIETFGGVASDYFSNIRESQELIYHKREKAKPKYYIKNSLVAGKGDYAMNAKNELVVTGAWEFYFDNGNLKSKGNFDPEGLRNGEWQYFYENGILKEKSFYLNGKANGKSLVWSDNGLPYTITTYAEDKAEGMETTYFYGGNLSSLVNHKEGLKDGVAKYYNINGYLKTVAHYANDVQEGEEITYHQNGKTESIQNYAKDLPVGEYREFYDNGKLKAKGNYIDGKKTGEWNNYFIDGKPEQRENYVKGELDGEWISYYPNGKMESRCTYKKGEIDGKKEDFDDDGIVYSELIFENGRLKDIKFFDKKGTVISNTTSRKGNADISFYGPDGIKQSQGYYSKDGTAEGKFSYYFKNGKISKESVFKNGLLEGKRTLYYANNKISQEGNYQDNNAHGYFVNYYNNGKVSDEGWYVKDEQQGTFKNYDLLENLTNKIYYLDGKANGIAEYFSPNGKIDYKQYFDNGWFNKIEQYDTMGNILATSILEKGEGKVHFNHFNGKPYFESNYKYYKLNGVYNVFNGDGSKNSVSYYKNGNLDSNYVTWYPNGKVHIEGNYSNGDKTGTWKYYYHNGKLFETEQYSDGKIEGLNFQYDEAGEVAYERNYKDGSLDGELKFYGDNKQLRVILYYKDNELQGYSYEDKAGKLLPMIHLKSGAGEVDGYYKNGVKSVHMVFNEGAVDGEKVFYSTNGKEQLTGTSINGQDNGVRNTYYTSGKLMKTENYYYGEKHGEYKYYNENGTLISALNYYLGNLHGECKYYTDGKLTQTYFYHYGVLESKK